MILQGKVLKDEDQLQVYGMNIDIEQKCDQAWQNRPHSAFYMYISTLPLSISSMQSHMCLEAYPTDSIPIALSSIRA